MHASQPLERSRINQFLFQVVIVNKVMNPIANFMTNFGKIDSFYVTLSLSKHLSQTKLSYRDFFFISVQNLCQVSKPLEPV